MKFAAPRPREISEALHSPQTWSSNKNGGVLELFSRLRRSTENQGFIRIKKIFHRSISNKKQIRFREKKNLGVRYGSHLGKVFKFAGKKATENLKLQPESKLLVLTIRVALGEKICQ